MILCDTNILIEFYKNNPAIVQELRDIGSDTISISVITQAELYFGALNKQELAAIRQHLRMIHRYSIDAGTATCFIDLMEQYALSHKPSIPDMLIAATALVHDIELYTLNIRDFRFIPKIRLYFPESN